MDKVDKAIQKLTKKEKEWVKEIVKSLQSGRFNNLNIKKLKGENDIFRARKGKIRIVYQIRESQVFVFKIGCKKEDTYKL